MAQMKRQFLNIIMQKTAAKSNLLRLRYTAESHRSYMNDFWLGRTERVNPIRTRLLGAVQN